MASVVCQAADLGGILSNPRQVVPLALGGLAFAWVVWYATGSVLHRLVQGTDTAVDNVVLDHLRVPVTITVVAGSALAVTPVIDGLPTVVFGVRASVLSVLVLVWGRTLVGLGNDLIELVESASDIHELVPIIENLWKFVVSVGGLFLLLSVWRIDVTPLLASASIAGVAVGFAARDTVANLFGGVALYVDNTYKVGDFVVLGTGESGTVVDISIRSTQILTRDGVIVTVPNSVLNSARVLNESSPRGHKRLRLAVGVAYRSDPDAVDEALLAAADESQYILDAPKPRSRFAGFGDSALEFELFAWVDDPTHELWAEDELNRGIYRRLNDRGIEIPFPQREVDVRGASPADDETVATSGDGTTAPADVDRGAPAGDDDRTGN
jgi:MscS family membrane protein